MSLDDVQRSRRLALIHALLFVVGFSIVFLALGATATAVGRLLLVKRIWISRVGGLLVILFGLYLLGAFDLSFFSRERRFHVTDKPLGYLGSVLVGIAFGAGWSPCIGPILGSILTYTATQADLNRGLVMLGFYSLGLAIPFLVAAVAIDRFIGLFRRFSRHMVWVNRLAGALMIAVGILLVTNYLTVLSSTLQAFTPEFIRSRL